MLRFSRDFHFHPYRIIDVNGLNEPQSIRTVEGYDGLLKFRESSPKPRHDGEHQRSVRNPRLVDALPSVYVICVQGIKITAYSREIDNVGIRKGSGRCLEQVALLEVLE